MVGIVLPVAAFMVPDGRFLVVEGYDISTLHAISYRGIMANLLERPIRQPNEGLSIMPNALLPKV